MYLHTCILQELLKFCVRANFLDPYLGFWREKAYKSGSKVIGGESVEGILRNFVRGDSEVTVDYNLSTFMMSLHLTVMCRISKADIPIELVTKKSDASSASSSIVDMTEQPTKRRQTFSWSPILTIQDEDDVESDLIKPFSKHLEWTIRKLKIAKCVSDVIDILSYSVVSDYDKLYQVFGLGLKPDQSNIPSHFAMCMASIRDSTHVDAIIDIIDPIVVENEEILIAALEEILNDENDLGEEVELD